MANNSYIEENLHTSVWILATSPSRIRDRLFAAYLEFHLIGGDMPSPFRSEYESVIALLTSQPDKGDGTVKATLEVMDEEQAVDIAKRICELAYKVPTNEDGEHN